MTTRASHDRFVQELWKVRGVTLKEYGNVHEWLYREYGKADHCEGTSCKGLSKTFQWALLRDKKYEKVRDNFIQFCSRCHGAYDTTDTTREKRRVIALEQNKVKALHAGLWKVRLPIPCGRCKRPLSRKSPAQRFCGNFREKTGCSFIKNQEYKAAWWLSHKNTL